MNPTIYVYFLIPFLLAIFLNSIKIQFLLIALKAKINLSGLLKLKLTSRSFSLFFPGQLGELSLVPLLKMKEIPMGKSLATVTIDKMISLLVLMTFASYGFFIFFGKATLWRVMFLFIGILLLLILLIAYSPFRRLIKKYILRKYSTLFRGFHSYVLLIVQKRKRVIFLNLFITTLWLAITSLVIQIILQHFLIDVNLLIIMSIQAVGALSAVIPISISGVGVRESIAVFLFSKLGVDPSIIVTMLLMFLCVSYLISAMTIIVVSKEYNLVTLKKIIEK